MFIAAQFIIARHVSNWNVHQQTSGLRRCGIYRDSGILLNHKKNDAAAAKSLQSCPTLCDPIDGSPPGSSVPGILQARTLEWAAISFSKKEWNTAVYSGVDGPREYYTE